jgi:hypothetical protein
MIEEQAVGIRGTANRSLLAQYAMATVGRLMQIVGLVVPPLAIVLQLQNAITAGRMLILLVASVCIFGIGRIVEGYARQ